MPRSFSRVTEILEHRPGTWYVRFVHKDGADEESEFLKFKQIEKPTASQISAVVSERISSMNIPPAPAFELIPENAPKLKAVTVQQQSVIDELWPSLRDKLRRRIEDKS